MLLHNSYLMGDTVLPLLVNSRQLCLCRSRVNPFLELLHVGVNTFFNLGLHVAVGQGVGKVDTRIVAKFFGDVVQGISFNVVRFLVEVLLRKGFRVIFVDEFLDRLRSLEHREFCHFLLSLLLRSSSFIGYLLDGVLFKLAHLAGN